jgi:hypothetical protein
MAIAVQAAGAFAILAAFALVQRSILSTHSRAYLLLNLAGGVATAAAAYVEKQWGFTLLQSVWALAAAVGLGVGRRKRA